MQKAFTARNSFPFVVIACIIIGYIFLLVCFSKADSFLLVNYYHSPRLDVFFTYFTYLGDGLFSVIASVVLFFVGKRLLGFQLLIAYLASGAVVQIIKRWVAAPRPQAFFPEGVYAHFISGITHSGMNSFPSGHTASAFAMALLLCLHTKNNGLQLLYLMVAGAVAYSRVYLGQHFVVDTFVGACIGMATAVMVFMYVPLPYFLHRTRRRSTTTH